MKLVTRTFVHDARAPNTADRYIHNIHYADDAINAGPLYTRISRCRRSSRSVMSYAALVIEKSALIDAGHDSSS
jgi:hypothetical protein